MARSNAVRRAMASLRKLAINMLRLAGTTNIATTTRWLAGNPQQTPTAGLRDTDFEDTLATQPPRKSPGSS